jgi:hypothetical protein
MGIFTDIHTLRWHMHREYHASTGEKSVTNWRDGNDWSGGNHCRMYSDPASDWRWYLPHFGMI